jgi:HTH-type transcriptional regulator/antitoxin MqsA
MPTQEATRRHPETGAILQRGMRRVTLSFRAQREVVDLPGWYPADDPSAENGLHDARDMRVSDRAITIMKARDAGLLTPEQIRRVRKKLGLSQRDAGRIIGGGPNAFQKYEAGDVLISKAADSALRLLANDPARLAELQGEGQMV